MSDLVPTTTPPEIVAEEGGGDPTAEELRKKIAEAREGVAADKAAEDAWVEKINKTHFYAPVGGVSRVWKITPDGAVPMRVETFRNNFANIKVPVKKGGKTRFIDMGSAWLGHPKRSQYLGGVGCYPKEGTCPSDTYNLWQGFAVEPKPGDWSIFREHIETNICQGDEALICYVLGWMAHAVQMPNEPAGTALALRGRQGTGKSVFGQHFGYIFHDGRHYLVINNRKHLTTRFNAHLMNKIVILVDDVAFSGDKGNWGYIKSLITSPTISVEYKGVDVIHVQNFLHMIITSNDNWVVPVEASDRRWCVIDVGEGRCKDVEFFSAMQKQLLEGGYSGLLYDLLRIPLINLLSIPKTKARDEQKIMSLDGVNAWWMDILLEGILPGTEVTEFMIWEGWAFRHVLYEHYRNSQKYPLDVSLWAKQLRIISGCINGSKKRYFGAGQKRTYTFPTLKECRERFERIVDITIDWDDADPGVGGAA